MTFEWNEAQRQAIYCRDENILVAAGAGSGKTTVLINRIANLLKFGRAGDSDELPYDADEKQLEILLAGGERAKYLAAFEPVEPWRILAITFTNKAAGELKDRLENMLGESARDIWACTFHSACVRILRRDAERLGYTSSFTIYDTSDSQSLIKHILKDMDIDDKMFAPRMLMAEISRAKDQGISASQYQEMPGDIRHKTIGRVYAEYSKRAFTANAMDFDDLIFNTVKLLEDNADVLDYWQRRFKYVLIDEYQDTNLLQYRLSSLLAGGWGNICVVGDDDQSIYKFRGATIENILSFESQYKNCRLIRLEQNYRSTAHILDSANAVISNNTRRKGKELWTDKDGGKRFLGAVDGRAEDRLGIRLAARALAVKAHDADLVIELFCRHKTVLLSSRMGATRLAKPPSLEFDTVGRSGKRSRAALRAVSGKQDVLIRTEADTETATAAPMVVTGVVIHPVRNGQGYAVEEHIARKVLVRLARHDHHAVRARLPVGQYDHVPVAVVQVDVVVAVAGRTFRTAHTLDDAFRRRTVAGQNDGVGRVAERIAVLVLHVAQTAGKLGKCLFKGFARREEIAAEVVRLRAAARAVGVIGGKERFAVGGGKVDRCACKRARKLRACAERVRTDLVLRLVVGACEVFGTALGIRRHAVVRIFHHFGGDDELLHELNVLDEFGVGFLHRVGFGRRALFGRTEDAELVVAENGFAETVGFLNVEEPVAHAALLCQKVAFVLDDHFDGCFKPAYRSVLCSCGF